ncbi:MAG: 4-hydroxyphenylacetate 3-hydroxylase [Nitrososphaerota archaeon]
MPARRGEDYLRSIRERQPVVYYQGERVSDVTSHKAFCTAVSTLARMYDLQWDPRYHERLTFRSPDTGEPVGITYMIPRSKEDLARIRRALMLIYEHLFGFFGRCYDYLNMWTAIFAAHAWDFFGEQEPRFGENVVKYHRRCREQDLFLTHAIVAPSVDRSKLASELRDPFVQVGCVEEGPEGIVVRGAAMVSTAAPYAEELIYFPNMLRDPDPRYALAFACPTNLRGIKFIARRAFTPREGFTEFEYPISSRYEESDAFVIFDDALIPWENVFLYRRPDKIPKLMWGGVYMKAWFNYHFCIQYYARLKFLTGLAALIAKAVGIDKFINVQEKIGELLIYLNLTEASVVAAEELGEQLPNGLFRPNPQISVSGSHFNMKAMPRAFEIIKLLAAGSLIALPSSAKDFKNPELRPYLEKYFAGSALSAVERVKLFNLAWDAVASELGQRYELYDRFSRGDPTIMWAKMYEQFDEQREECIRLAKSFLDAIPNP